MHPFSAPANQLIPLRIGLFGVGLDSYWGQFSGLRQRLEGYLGAIERGLGGDGSDVISGGLVDGVEQAHRAAALFKAKDVRIIFLYVSTYALSSTVLSVVRDMHVPVVVLNLQPEKRIDYECVSSFGHPVSPDHWNTVRSCRSATRTAGIGSAWA